MSATRYFAAIDYNRDESFSWAAPESTTALQAVQWSEYDARLTDDVKSGQHVRSLKELQTLDTGVIVVWCVAWWRSVVLRCAVL